MALPKLYLPHSDLTGLIRGKVDPFQKCPKEKWYEEVTYAGNESGVLLLPTDHQRNGGESAAVLKLACVDGRFYY